MDEYTGLANAGDFAQVMEPEQVVGLTYAPPARTVLGLDLSHNQGYIEVENLPEWVKFAIIRLSSGYGRFFYDRYWPTYYGQLRERMFLGAYHYLYTAGWLDNIRKFAAAYRLGDFPLGAWLDVEQQGLNEYIVKNALDEFAQVTGESFRGIYTSCYMWRQLVQNPGWSTDYDLWTAHWGSVSAPCVPPPWEAWRFWQYTNRGSVSGIAGYVDLNKFFGNLDELSDYAGNNKPPQPIKQRYIIEVDGHCPVKVLPVQ